jgi:hypothetical protein
MEPTCNGIFDWASKSTIASFNNHAEVKISGACDSSASSSSYTF